MQWGGHNYFLSWREPWHKFEDWDWFNGRNFCRDRCMDLVSFDTAQENDLFSAIIRQGQKVVPLLRILLLLTFFQKLIHIVYQYKGRYIFRNRIREKSNFGCCTMEFILRSTLLQIVLNRSGVVKLNVCTLLLTSSRSMNCCILYLFFKTLSIIY